MKRLSSIILAVLFVTGAFIIPAVHRTQCADDHATRGADACAICQTAHTPLQLSAVVLVPVDTVRLIETLVPPSCFVPPFSPRTAAQARAPPVA